MFVNKEELKKMGVEEDTLKDALGGMAIPKSEFITIHDFVASVLNAAKVLSEQDDAKDQDLSREECAGRILMVTMLQMEKFASENPDAIEELLISKHMEEEQKHSHSLDAMYG